MNSAARPSSASTPLTRVLCVDDNTDITAALRMIIGCERSMVCVGCLSSTDDLIREVKRYDPLPDVLILDATMPGMDPLAAMKELSVACPETRTIIYSGHNDQEFVDRAVDAGAWGCVSKSDEPEAILRAVREVAAGRALDSRR